MLENQISTTIKQKVYKKPTIQKLLESNEDGDAMETIRQYFYQFQKDLEDKRFSNLSKQIFRYLKKAFKYDLIDKKDGSIISIIKSKDSKDIITGPTEVNKDLMRTIIEVQVDCLKPQPKNLRFPDLNAFKIDEMKSILTKLTCGKAITWDGITDSIFRKSWEEKTVKIFSQAYSKT